MSRNRGAHLLAFALDHPWAITPTMLPVVARILSGYLAEKPADPLVVADAIAARRPDGPPPARGGTALIPVYGVIAPRANFLTQSSGGTSFEELTRQTRAAVASADIKTIVFDIDSPGGSAAGAAEFAAELRAARAKKPVIAVANHQACSAGYWIGAQATKFYASPSALVGSVGVYTLHDDLSEALAQHGIKREYISAGKFKVEGNETGPLTDDARAHLLHLVSRTFDAFVADVAKGRGVPAATVVAGYGEGRVLRAPDALDAGMVDAIQTLDDTLAPLGPPRAADGADPAWALTDTLKEPDGVTGKDPRAACYASVRAIERALFDWALS